MDFKQRLLARKRFFEEEVQHYHGPDPLKVRCDFISWLENYAKDENITDIYFPVLEETLKLFVEEPIYKQDIRFIRLWLNYSVTQPNPAEVIKNIHSRGLGTECSILYSSWAEQLIKIGSYWHADNVFQMGLNGNIQAKEGLQKQYDDFLKDIGKKVITGTLQCPKCKTILQTNGTDCNENLSEKVENWEWNPLKAGEVDDFHCPIAYFEEDDPSRPQIRMYPKHKVYPREGQEFSLEEILAAEYEQKYKEEEERERVRVLAEERERALAEERERAQAEERERAQAEAMAREEEARRIRKMGAGMFNPPVQATIPVITPNMMNVPKDMQNSLADSTAITVHTKEAMNVIQDMWSSPAISQVRPRLYQNEKPPDAAHARQFEVYREEEPGAQKTPFQIYDENNGMARKASRPSSKPRLLDMNNDENAPPGQQILHFPNQANNLKHKPPIEIYQDDVQMKSPDGKSAEDLHTKNLAEKFEAQARIHQPMFVDQDRNNDFSDLTCNTNAFAFVLPSSTPVHKSANKPLNSIYRNDPSNLSMILEQSKDRSGNSSTSSQVSNNKTVKSVLQADEDYISENGLPEGQISSFPHCRPSSFHRNTFLDTISEEDSSDLSSSLATALPLSTSAQSRHMSPNKTYLVDVNVNPLRKSVTDKSLSNKKPNRKLKERPNNSIDKENLSPGTPGFPSNNLLELPNSAVPLTRINRCKPLASLHDQENITDRGSLYQVTDGTGASVSQESTCNMDLEDCRLEKEKLSLIKSPLRVSQTVAPNKHSISTGNLTRLKEKTQDNCQWNKVDENLKHGLHKYFIVDNNCNKPRGDNYQSTFSIDVKGKCNGHTKNKEVKSSNLNNNAEESLTAPEQTTCKVKKTTDTNTLQELDVTTTHLNKDKTLNDEYQHFTGEINKNINVESKESENILKVNVEFATKSIKQRGRVSKLTQNIDKRVSSSSLGNKRSLSQEIEREFISQSRCNTPKDSKQKSKREENVATMKNHGISLNKIPLQSSTRVSSMKSHDISLNKIPLRRSSRLSSKVEGNKPGKGSYFKAETEASNENRVSQGISCGVNPDGLPLEMGKLALSQNHLRDSQIEVFHKHSLSTGNQTTLEEKTQDNSQCNMIIDNSHNEYTKNKEVKNVATSKVFIKKHHETSNGPEKCSRSSKINKIVGDSWAAPEQTTFTVQHSLQEMYMAVTHLNRDKVLDDGSEHFIEERNECLKVDDVGNENILKGKSELDTKSIHQRRSKKRVSTSTLSNKRSLTHEIELELISQSKGFTMDDPKVIKHKSRWEENVIMKSDISLNKIPLHSSTRDNSKINKSGKGSLYHFTTGTGTVNACVSQGSSGNTDPDLLHLEMEKLVLRKSQLRNSQIEVPRKHSLSTGNQTTLEEKTQDNSQCNIIGGNLKHRIHKKSVDNVCSHTENYHSNFSKDVKWERIEHIKNNEVENVTSKVEIMNHLKKSVGPETCWRSSNVNKNFDNSGAAQEQTTFTVHHSLQEMDMTVTHLNRYEALNDEYQHFNEESNECIKVTDVGNEYISKAKSELDINSNKRTRRSKQAQIERKKPSALINKRSLSRGIDEKIISQSKNISLDEPKVCKHNSRWEENVVTMKSDEIIMKKISLRRSTRVSSTVKPDIFKNYLNLSDSEKLKNTKKSTKKKMLGTRKRAQSKLAPCSSISVSDTFDPFNSEVIESLLEKAGFPKAHHLNSYFVKQTNLPTGTKTMKLGDESLILQGEIGKGAYAKVVKASSSTGNVLALKIEKPPCKWEFYIAKEIRNRVSPKYASLFMDISAGYFYNNGSILETPYAKYGSLLTNVNIYKEKARKSLDLGVIIHFALELIEIVEFLHKCKIIHADMKADNIVLRELPSRDDSEPCLQLIDFGRCIDMSLFPPDTKFQTVFKTEDNKCIEMKENKPWSYQIDLHGLASIFHVLLFSEYMKVHKKNDVWCLQKLISRNLKRELWNPIFESLLNVNSQTDLPFNFSPMRDSLIEVYNSLLPNCLQHLSVFNNIITGK